MKAKECIEKPRTGKWIKRMALAAAAFKDDSIGHRGLHRVRLSVFKRRVARVDGSRHRLFQGILQVPL